MSALPHTFSLRELEHGLILAGERYDDEDTSILDGVVRCCPTTRPCPWVSCKHHLYLDISFGGGLHVNHPDLHPWELSETCAIDVAMAGPAKLREVGEILNLTRERVRQLEAQGIRRAARNAKLHMGMTYEDTGARDMEEFRDERISQTMESLADPTATGTAVYVRVPTPTGVPSAIPLCQPRKRTGEQEQRRRKGDLEGIGIDLFGQRANSKRFKRLAADVAKLLNARTS